MELKSARVRTKFIQKNECGDVFCYTCKDFKPIDEFDSNSTAWFREFKDRRCKGCKSLQRHKRRLANRGDGSIDRIITERFCGVRDRAKKHGLELDFDREYLLELWTEQEGKCALSGIEMTSTIFSGRTPTNMSVDRIDSNKGYIKGNIQLVCMAANQMKSDLTQNELLYFCTKILQNESKNN